MAAAVQSIAHVLQPHHDRLMDLAASSLSSPQRPLLAPPTSASQQQRASPSSTSPPSQPFRVDNDAPQDTSERPSLEHDRQQVLHQHDFDLASVAQSPIPMTATAPSMEVTSSTDSTQSSAVSVASESLSNSGLSFAAPASLGSSSPSRPRLQSLSRSAASVARPEKQIHTPATTSRASPWRQHSALQTLQAAAASSASLQHQPFGDAEPYANVLNATPKANKRAQAMSTPTRPALSPPPSPAADYFSRSRTKSNAAAMSPNKYSGGHAQFTTAPRASVERSRTLPIERRMSAGALPLAVHHGQTQAQAQAQAQTLAPLAAVPVARERPPKPSQPLEAKVVILGAQGVGKTSLVHRYISGHFLASAIPSTIGASFLTKKLVVDDVKCRLQLWDTAGQERFRSMAPMYYRGSNAAIIVYDITSADSFADVKTWIEELRKNMGKDLIIHVVGSKLDLADRARQVDRDEAHEQILQWLFPERKAAIAALSKPGNSLGSPAKRSSQITLNSRIGTLSSLALSSAGMLARSGGSQSRLHTPNVTTPNSPPETASGTDSDDGGDRTMIYHSLPGDEADVEITEVSAKDDDGIEDVFFSITQKLVLRKAEIERRREERERNSIFLHASEAGQDEDANGGLQVQKAWTCC